MLDTYGLKGFFERLDMDVLEKICFILGLDTIHTKDDMILCIVDEIILEGMEAFLRYLPENILKDHCIDLSISSKGKKEVLIER